MAGNLTKNGGKRNKNGGKPSNNSGKRSIFIYDWLETLTFFSRWRFLRQNWHLAQHSWWEDSFWFEVLTVHQKENSPITLSLTEEDSKAKDYRPRKTSTLSVYYSACVSWRKLWSGIKLNHGHKLVQWRPVLHFSSIFFALHTCLLVLLLVQWSFVSFGGCISIQGDLICRQIGFSSATGLEKYHCISLFHDRPACI